STGDDDNNYYPVISPDGAFVVFNKSGSPNPLSNNDCGLYANPGAELFIVASSGGAPLRLDRANGKVARVNNSWAKWAPAGSSDEVWWLAFSSMRDYGSLLQNSKMPRGQRSHKFGLRRSAQGRALIPATRLSGSQDKTSPAGITCPIGRAA
ncbi:MAG: hypothetical protein JRH20_18770, partial [Deltaproteobacteria bacterium]|nr:hypothetical protein [Deltaproteobacteria bacterium]